MSNAIQKDVEIGLYEEYNSMAMTGQLQEPLHV